MQEDSTGPRVARDAMVLGSGGSVDQGTPTAPSLEDTTETATFQQVPQQRGVPEFYMCGFWIPGIQFWKILI